MFVVKIGGAIGTGFENLAEDLINYKDYILVHGGSHEMNIISEKLDVPPRFVRNLSLKDYRRRLCELQAI